MGIVEDIRQELIDGEHSEDEKVKEYIEELTKIMVQSSKFKIIETIAQDLLEDEEVLENDALDYHLGFL